jgi:hypothetical protein
MGSGSRGARSTAARVDSARARDVRARLLARFVHLADPAPASLNFVLRTRRERSLARTRTAPAPRRVAENDSQSTGVASRARDKVLSALNPRVRHARAGSLLGLQAISGRVVALGRPPRGGAIAWFSGLKQVRERLLKLEGGVPRAGAAGLHRLRPSGSRMARAGCRLIAATPPVSRIGWRRCGELDSARSTNASTPSLYSARGRVATRRRVSTTRSGKARIAPEAESYRSGWAG